MHKGDDAIPFPTATWPACRHCLHMEPLLPALSAQDCAFGIHCIPLSTAPLLAGLCAHLCLHACACALHGGCFCRKVTRVVCCGEPCGLCVRINLKLRWGEGGHTVATSNRLPIY